MKKWALAFAVSLTIFALLGCSSTEAAASTSLFPDVAVDSPYADAIRALREAQVIDGFDNGPFGPTAGVTRQQFAKMIVLALRIPISEADVSPYSDVESSPAGSLYPDHYIAVCAANHITLGTNPSKFSPDRQITWAQAITMVVRAAHGLRPRALRIPPRVYISTWGEFDPTHGPAAAEAEYNGLLAKLPIRSVSPWEDMSREEVAQLLANLVVENVRDFGASGDGVADNTDSIQAAIDRAGVSGGGIVFFPAGIYKTTGLRVTFSGIVLTGEGEDSVLTVAAPAQSPMITLEGRDSLEDVVVRNLGLIGDYSQSTQIGISIKGLRNGRLDNLSILDVGFCGIYAFPAFDVVVNNCTITHCGDFGIHFKEASSSITVSHCRLDQFQSRLYPGHGIYFSNASNCTAFGNHITRVVDAPGMYEVSGIKYAGSSGHCYENVVEDSFAGISTPDAHNVLIEGNTIRRTPARGIYVLAGASDITIKNNALEDMPCGIKLNAFDAWPTNVRIIDNTFTDVESAVDLSGGPSSMVVEMSGNSLQQPALSP